MNDSLILNLLPKKNDFNCKSRFYAYIDLLAIQTERSELEKEIEMHRDDCGEYH